MAYRTKTTQAFEEAYQQLNPGQKQAVDTIDGPVMVLAGPGTGKTQTLTVRIGKILQETQLDPWNILCLTFTEAAATEMRERLAGLIGSSAYSVRIGTFHSFCNEVIQDHPELFALVPNWQPLSDVERVEFIQKALDALPGTSPLKPFGNPYLYLRDCVQHIQALKQEDISPSNFSHVLEAIEGFVKQVQDSVADFSALKPSDRSDADCTQIQETLLAAAGALPDSLQSTLKDTYIRFQEASEDAEGKREASKVRTKYKNDIKKIVTNLSGHLPRQKELVAVYREYLKQLQEMGRYDFEDMIVMVVEAFKKEPNLLAQYQEQFQYVLVDEFQDTNGAQSEVVELLGSYDDQPNVFVVGDDKQSIYRFQGASLANMLSFYKRYSDHVAVFSLAENYRNNATILRAASHLIEHNAHSLRKEIPDIEEALVPKSSLEPKPLQLQSFQFPDQELAYVAHSIAGLVKKGEEPSEIAVLVRYNRDAEELVALLQNLDVPVVLTAGVNVLEQVAVKEWLRVWRYVGGGERSDHLLADIVQAPWWGVDALDALRAIHFAGRKRKSLTETFSDSALLQEAGLSDIDSLVAVMRQLAAWRSLATRMTIDGLLTAMLDESGWLTFITREEKDFFSLEYMRTVIELAKQAQQRQKQMSLPDFIATIDLYAKHSVALHASAQRLSNKAVQVMTAHKSKGREFTHVFLPRFVDGKWGGGRAPHTLPLPHGLVRYDVVAEDEGAEDERRLLYVALTRARKNVFISRAEVSGTDRLTVPSRFEREIPEDTLDVKAVQETKTETTDRLAKLQLSVPVPITTPLKEWLEGILRTYVLSVTHLNNYLEDPKLFYERNILRVPSVRTSHQAMGTAVHYALDVFFTEFQSSQTLPPKKFLLEQFVRSLERESLTSQEESDAKSVGTHHLSQYYDHYHASFTSKTLGEYDFRQHHVRINNNIPITGKIDKIELLDGKKINVVDYKTGSPERGSLRTKPGGEYHRQIVFYKLLCDNSEQFPYDMVTGEIDFIRPSKAGKFVKKKIEVTSDDVEELTETVARVWQEIMDLKFLESIPE